MGLGQVIGVSCERYSRLLATLLEDSALDPCRHPQKIPGALQPYNPHPNLASLLEPQDAKLEDELGNPEYAQKPLEDGGYGPPAKPPEG